MSLFLSKGRQPTLKGYPPTPRAEANRLFPVSLSSHADEPLLIPTAHRKPGLSGDGAHSPRTSSRHAKSPGQRQSAFLSDRKGLFGVQSSYLHSDYTHLLIFVK